MWSYLSYLGKASSHAMQSPQCPPKLVPSLECFERVGKLEVANETGAVHCASEGLGDVLNRLAKYYHT